MPAPRLPHTIAAMRAFRRLEGAARAAYARTGDAVHLDLDSAKQRLRDALLQDTPGINQPHHVEGLPYWTILEMAEAADEWNTIQGV